MKKIILLVVILVMFGCTKTIYIPVTHTITEIEYRDRLQRDSIYFSDSVLIFQFLMVRLKERHRNLNSGLNDISIPYGSIKRHNDWAWGSRQMRISIPYGSIKRNLAFGIIQTYLHFNSLWFD